MQAEGVLWYMYGQPNIDGTPLSNILYDFYGKKIRITVEEIE